MAWDFETDPEFEAQLVWMRSFVKEEIFPLETLRLPYTLESLSRENSLSVGVPEKAERLLGWRAKLPLERAVRNYVAL